MPATPTSAPFTPPTEVKPVVKTAVVQVVQPVQRVESKEIREEVREVRAVEPVVERQVQTVTRMAEAVVPAPPAPPVVVHSTTTVSTAAPVVEAPRAEAMVQANQSVVQAMPTPMIATPTLDTATASDREVVDPKAPVSQPAPGPVEAPPSQVAALPAAPVMPKPGAKVDNRWVGEALGDRVRELLVYPTKARLNNLSGRVLVKVVIREDGQLHQVEIIKGSGHDVLDEAAVELVRRATPIKMKHVLGRPLVTITLPITYELVG